MLRSLLPPARRALQPAPTRSARRGLIRWAALGLVAVATMTAPAIGPAAATAADTETHPTFAASYLSGVSGPRPERTVSLSGTWGFTPVTDTVCVGGGPFGTSTGPMTCTDSPASAGTPRSRSPEAVGSSRAGPTCRWRATPARSACRTSPTAR